MTQHQSQRRCTWGRARQCGRLHSLQTRLASGCGEIFTNGRTGSTSRRTLWTVPRVSRDRTVAALQRAAPALRQFIEGKFTLLARATPIPTRLSERAHYYCIEGLMECLEGVDRRFAAKKGSGHRRLCAHDHPDWQHHQDTFRPLGATLWWEFRDAHSTQGFTAAYIAKASTATVADQGETPSKYWWCIEQTGDGSRSRLVRPARRRQ